MNRPSPALAAYDFDERDWDGYRDLCQSFEWQIPDCFNIADYVCSRWASTDAVALTAVAPDGQSRDMTFAHLEDRSDRLAAYLRDQGVERGDRVGICAPLNRRWQRPTLRSGKSGR